MFRRTKNVQRDTNKKPFVKTLDTKRHQQ